MRKGKYDELFEIGIMKMDKPHKMLKLDSQSKYGQLIALAREAWHAYNKFIKAKTDDAYTKFQGKFEELIKDRKYRTFDYYDMKSFIWIQDLHQLCKTIKNWLKPSLKI